MEILNSFLTQVNFKFRGPISGTKSREIVELQSLHVTDI